MTERRKRLTEKLQELDEHIGSGEPIEAPLDEPLRQTIGSLRQVIETPPENDEDHRDLSEALGDIALQLEVSHPTFTRLLNQISGILSGAGI